MGRVAAGDASKGAPHPSSLLGVVLAGGESRRFGKNKALAEIAGKPMARWALEALRAHTSHCVTVANDPEVARVLGIPGRPDDLPGLGPVGGLLTALRWAGEDGRDGLFLLACDLPMVSSALVGEVLASWPRDALAVVPESPGPLGVEPLCAGYRVAGLPEVRRLARGTSRSMEEVLAVLRAHRIPMDGLGGVRELSRAFANVNTPDQARALDPSEREAVWRVHGLPEPGREVS